MRLTQEDLDCIRWMTPDEKWHYFACKKQVQLRRLIADPEALKAVGREELGLRMQDTSEPKFVLPEILHGCRWRILARDEELALGKKLTDCYPDVIRSYYRELYDYILVLLCEIYSGNNLAVLDEKGQLHRYCLRSTNVDRAWMSLAGWKGFVFIDPVSLQMTGRATIAIN